MTFTSLSSISERLRKTRGGHKVKRNSDALLMASAIYMNSKSNRTRAFAISFSIFPALMKRARFIMGDRVDIFFDVRDKTGLIKRVAEGGFKLCPRGGSSANGVGTIKLTWYPGMPSTPTTVEMESVSVENEGILFVFPKTVVFGPFARSEEINARK